MTHITELLPTSFRRVSPKPQHNSGVLPRYLYFSLCWLCSLTVYAAKVPTTTQLSVSSNYLHSQSVVTLTATVKAGGGSVSPGQVVFCNADAKYCEDSAVWGVAQLTQTGNAVLKHLVSPGTHRIKAVFKGTNAAMSSNSDVVTIEAFYEYSGIPTSTTISASYANGKSALSSVVTAHSAQAPTGQVFFHEVSGGNRCLGAIPLDVPTATLGFRPAKTFGEQLRNPMFISTGDLNGDGYPDILEGRELGGTEIDPDLYTLLGDASHPGAFVSGPSFRIQAIVGTVTIGDFNSDGVPDLALGTTSAVAIYLGNSVNPGNFLPPVIYDTTPDYISLPVSMATGDFNGDGVADLVISEQSQLIYGFRLLLGDPSHPGKFLVQQPYVIPNSGEAFSTMADFNGDGLPDVAVSNQTAVVVYLNDVTHPGKFLPPATYPIDDGPTQIASGDFNNDGLADVVVGTRSTYIAILFSDPAHPGTLVRQPNIPIGPRWFSYVTVGDFNGDGFADIAVTNEVNEDKYTGITDPGALHVVLNDPAKPGQFMPVKRFKTDFAPRDLSAADFNGDGLADVTISIGGYAEVFLADEVQKAIVTLPPRAVSDPAKHYAEAFYSGDENFRRGRSCAINMAGLAPTVPTISGVSVSNISATTAIIAWTTDIPTAGYVDYGATAALGSISRSGSSTSTYHSAKLTGLAPGALYYFQVHAAAYSSGCKTSESVSAEQSFSTAVH